MGLSDSPLCRCGAQEETSTHILCEREALAALRHVHLGSFFLDPEDIKFIRGARGGVVVKALRYKPAGRKFDS